MMMASRVVGGRLKIEESSGAVQHQLMDVTPSGYDSSTADDRMKRFKNAVKEAERRKNGLRARSQVPKIKVPPLEVELEEKQRRLHEHMELAGAIMEAVLTKTNREKQIPEATRRRPKSPLPRPPSHNPDMVPESKPTVPRPNTTQARLVSDLSGVQKSRVNKTQLFNGQGEAARRVNGQVKTMLARTNQSSLTIPTRAADFRSEVASV